MKKIFIFILITGVVALVVWRQVYSGANFASVSIEGFRIQAEIVKNSKDMERGLGNREYLCRDCGMLFDFETRGQRLFWMKNMRFPLDILWIDGNQVVSISKNVAPDYPGVFNPPVLADKVLEINGGLSDEYGIKIGSKAVFN